MSGGSGGGGPGRLRARNVVAVATQSKESQAVSVLIDPKAWSDPNPLAYRQSLIHVVSNRPLVNNDLPYAVAASIQGLRNITKQSLEIADLICAWGLMHPNLPDTSAIISGVRETSLSNDPNAEAMLIGCFEVTNESGRGVHDGLALLEFIEYHLSHDKWIGRECLCTSQADGRLSNALNRFVQGLWGGHPAMNRRLAKLARVMRSDLDRPTDIPKVLHDHLINELTAKIFLQAPPSYRVFILRDGLVPVVAKHLERFEGED
jgi:hypothetical protein